MIDSATLLNREDWMRVLTHAAQDVDGCAMGSDERARAMIVLTMHCEAAARTSVGASVLATFVSVAVIALKPVRS